MNPLSFSASVNLDVKGLGSLSSRGGGAQLALSAGPFLRRELEVVSFSATEALSAPYVYDVVFDAAVPEATLRTGAFGFPACLTIATATDEPRVIQGLAVGIGAIGAPDTNLRTDVRRYTMRIAPRLWLLHHNRTFRVFQDQSAIEIACAVLAAADISPAVRLERADYPPLPFVYQRGETDLEFLNHVLAVAGVFYYFEHASGLLDALVPGAGEAGAIAGDLLGGLADSVAQAVGATTKLVLCDMSRRTTALQPASLLATVGAAASAGLRALGGPVASAIGGAVEAAASASGALAYDADGEAATASERVFAFRVDGEVRPKGISVQAWDPVENTGVESSARSAPLSLSLDSSAGLSASLDLHASLGGGASFGGALAVATGGLSAGLGLSGRVEADAIGIATKSLSVMEYQRDASVLAASDPFAARALRQLRSDRVKGYGDTDCRRLAPGYRFTLAQHPVASVNTEYVVTSIRSTAYAPDHLPAGTPHLFRSTFECVPSSIDLLPPKPPPRPPLAREPATVVGPAYGDVHCDSRGRVFVRFHWAPSAPTFSETDAGVCRVQWLERFAGNGYGTMTFPRVGSEVIVDFLQDEGGTPVAIGQVYSGENLPPFTFEGEASKLGIRSRSLPEGGGYNEISIDDRPEGKVYVRAQQDHETDVLVDQRLHVFRNETAHVDGSAARVIGGASLVTIGSDETTTVAGKRTSSVGGDLSAVVGGSASMEVRDDIKATAASTLSVHVGGGLVIEAAAGASLNVGESLEATVGGDETRTIAGRSTTTIGTDGGSDSGGGSDTSVAGPYTVSASGEIVLESPKGIVLRCGNAQISLTPQSIAMLADVLQGSAAKQLELSGAGPSITLSDTFDVMAKSMTLQSSGAQLALSDTATLTGNKVKLGNGSSSAPSPSSPSLLPPQSLSLRVVDRSGEPLGNATYQLAISGTTSQGITDPVGNLQAEVDPHATSARLTVWTKDFPEGPRITYAIDLRPLTEVSSIEGAQRRLANLGHHRGPITGQMNLATRDALLVFQLHHGLVPTGLLDEPTRMALTAKHPLDAPGRSPWMIPNSRSRTPLLIRLPASRAYCPPAPHA